MDDDDLVDGFAAGDPAAVRELYDRYGALVHAAAQRLVHDPWVAEEITQETFLRAWRNAGRFDRTRSLAPWLVVIAKRVAIDVIRRDAARPRSDGMPGADEIPAAVGPAAMDAVDTVVSVRRAMALLPRHYREVVRLHHHVGLSQAEISEHLGIPIGTVKSRSHKAHRMLAEALHDLRGEDAGPPRRTEPGRRRHRRSGRRSRQPGGGGGNGSGSAKRRSTFVVMRATSLS